MKNEIRSEASSIRIEPPLNAEQMQNTIIGQCTMLSAANECAFMKRKGIIAETQNLSLRSLSTSFALRLALAITLLQTGHAGLANLGISGVESFKFVCGNNCGELDTGILRGLALDDFAIFHSSRGICVAVCGTDEDRGWGVGDGVN